MTPLPDNKPLGQPIPRPGGRDFTRRDFIKGTLAAGVVVGGGLGALYFGYEKALGSPVRVGVIGTGDEGCVLIGAINPSFIQVKSIADIRPYNIWRGLHGDHYSDEALKVRPGLLSKYGWKTENQARKHVKVYGTYQELIENAKADGLEGVIIALPLHLHAQAAVAAMKAGLHVLTEKLMAHSVHECKEMAWVAQKTKLYLATGHQRHYNILYANAVESIRRGLLGDMHYIRAQWHRGNM
ncbi:MAG TPA: Gfo/Idh/MocA family oxidoreductase, partial [Thermoguttaceae bacterium]